jgi:hypothetical protein
MADWPGLNSLFMRLRRFKRRVRMAQNATSKAPRGPLVNVAGGVEKPGGGRNASCSNRDEK